ncbi:MAG: M28 family peptidase [Caldithrix sp.]|nr:M28 family peptidase [Caldithrix sp.]
MRILIMIKSLCVSTLVWLTFVWYGSGLMAADIPSLVGNVSQDSIKKHVTALCDAGGHQTRVNFTDGCYWSAEYIAQYFEQLDHVHSVVRDSFTVYSHAAPYNTYPMINIIANFKSDDPDAELILLGAHYDASGSRESDWQENWKTMKAQGADDNATGVAAIMEIGRILSQNYADLALKHDIQLIAFAAEEYHPTNPNVHHAGSLWDAMHKSDNEEPLMASIILDMIGYNNYYDYVEVISDNQSLWLADVVYENMQTYTPDLNTNSTPSDVSFSDHDSYQLYDFTSILLMENDRPWNNDSPYYQSNPYYHSRGDKIITLNFNQVEKVTQAALASTVSLSSPQETGLVRQAPPEPQNNFSAVISPNPFNHSTSIRLTVNTATPLTIDVFNAAGQKVEQICTGKNFYAGEHYVRWQAGTKASGVYYCRIHNGQQQSIKKMMLLK